MFNCEQSPTKRRLVNVSLTMSFGGENARFGETVCVVRSQRNREIMTMSTVKSMDDVL